MKVSLTVSDIMRETGMTRQHINKEIRRGNLKASGDGYRHWVTLEDFEAWRNNPRFGSKTKSRLGD